MRTTQQQRGVTLIESAIVLAVVAVSVGAVMPRFDRFVEKQKLDGAASQLVTDLQFARSEAVMRNTALRVSVQSESWGGCYVIHTGDAGACRCEGAGPAVCSGEAREIKTVNLPASERIAFSANVASVLFDPLHGTSTPSGTFKLVADSGHAVHGTVNLMGRVRTCTPKGLLSEVPGHAIC